MSALKPIKVHSHYSSPNPWKVIIILKELGVPYENIIYQNLMEIVKKEPYVSLNPNGRVPTIEDPNTGITLWESGAIIQYLVDVYDMEGKISYKTAPEKYFCDQWLHFQTSGQGPYFGQLGWFEHLHPEKLPSAIERYSKEAERVLSVLDGWLQKHEYLVGDKATFADFAFLPYCNALGVLAAGSKVGKGPAYEAWFSKLMSRPAVKEVFEEQEKAMADASEARVRAH